MAGVSEKPSTRRRKIEAEEVEDKPPRRPRREIKRIDDKQKRHVCFWKRRTGLFKKAADLSILCNIDIAVVAFSPGGSPFTFGTPSVEAVIDRYLPFRQSPPPGHEGAAAPASAAAPFLGEPSGKILLDMETSVEGPAPSSEAEMKWCEENVAGMKQSLEELQSTSRIKTEEEFRFDAALEPEQCSLEASFAAVPLLAAPPLIQPCEGMHAYDGLPQDAVFLGTCEEQVIFETATQPGQYPQSPARKQ